MKRTKPLKCSQCGQVIAAVDRGQSSPQFCSEVCWLEHDLICMLWCGFWMSLQALACNLNLSEETVQKAAERIYWRGAKGAKHPKLLRTFYRGDWWYRRKDA